MPWGKGNSSRGTPSINRRGQGHKPGSSTYKGPAQTNSKSSAKNLPRSGGSGNNKNK